MSENFEGRILKLLSDNKDELFQEERGMQQFLNLFQLLKEKGDQYKEDPFIKKVIDEFDEINQEESYDYPFSEFIADKLNTELNAEFQYLLENKKYVWEYTPNRVAALCESIHMGLDEFKGRIREQIINRFQLGSVMARSDNATVQQMQSANAKFAIQIEEKKRESFLKAIEQHLK